MSITTTSRIIMLFARSVTLCATSSSREIQNYYALYELTFLDAQKRMIRNGSRTHAHTYLA